MELNPGIHSRQKANVEKTMTDGQQRNVPTLFLIVAIGSLFVAVLNFQSSETIRHYAHIPKEFQEHIQMVMETEKWSKTEGLIERPPVDEAPTETEAPTTTTIAYAISITKCQDHMDGAAVLKHSIHLASSRNPESGSRYDYKMFAFVHPVAINCTAQLTEWGYEVQIRETPFDMEQIRGNFKNHVTKNGCCGEKEWLKLYTYSLVDYPVAIHLDLDAILLKPFDALFDAMIYNDRTKLDIMWKNQSQPERIDAFFTRDYNLVHPGRRQPHQIGVQGGFLVVRPNMTTIDEYVDLILEGEFNPHEGWGGKLRYGGYYGATTIQGLAAYYYGSIRPHKAVELNRCVYNNMVDQPKIDDKCKTTEDTCEDCRLARLENVKSVHFTVCWKPWFCLGDDTHWQEGTGDLCSQLHHEWFRIRNEFEKSIGLYEPDGKEGLASFGYCKRGRYHRIPIRELPSESETE